MNTIISYIITFVAGGVSTYFVSRLLEKAKLKDSQKEMSKNFVKIKKEMPDLINEIKNDLSINRSFRLFFILANKKETLNVKGQYLLYYETEHPNLMHKISILENYGFIHNVTETNTPKFRFDETFIDLLLKNKNATQQRV